MPHGQTSRSASDSSANCSAAKSRSFNTQLYPAGHDGVSARFITLASGLRIRIVESGEADAPAIVLVPGWGCSAWIFHETLVPLASAGFHAIAVELKGHGLSDKPDDPRQFTVTSMRDHLREIFDALEIERGGLVGHSMGAAIAGQFAKTDVQRVSGLVLAAPVGFAGVKGLWLFRLITPKFLLALLQLLATRFVIRVMLSVVYGSLRRASNQDIEEFYSQTRTPGFVRSLRYLLHEFEWRSAFPVLSVPVMTIVGDEDVLSPSADAERYGADSTVIVPGAGHVLFDEAPEIVNAAIAEFFAASEAAYISSGHEQIKG